MPQRFDRNHPLHPAFALEGWLALVWPDRRRALRLILLAPMLAFFGSMIPWLIGWPKLPNPWHDLAWDSHLFAPVVGIDFFAIYEAGAQLRAGGLPYMVDGTTIHEIGGPLKAPYVATYRYLPITTYWLAAPLSLMQPWQALRVWIALLAALDLWALGVTVALARRWRFGWWGDVAAAAIWLCWFPLSVEMHMGQFSFFMAILMFAFAVPWAMPGEIGRAARTDPPTWRMVPWALSVWLKNFSALWWPWWAGLWWRWRKTPRSKAAYRSLLWATLVPTVLALSTLWYFSTRNETVSRSHFHDRALAERVGGTQPYHLYWGRQGAGLAIALTEALPVLVTLPPDFMGPNMIDEMQRMLPRPISPALTFALSAILGAAAVAAAFWSGLRGRRTLEAFALVWLWWFLTYVDCWEHHYTMLLPLLALLAFSRRLPPWLAAVCALSWGLPSLWYFVGEYYDALASTPYLRGLLIWGYFAQRPLGVFLALAWVTRRLLSVQSRPAPSRGA